MGRLSDIRDAITARIETVPEIGSVHSFERYAAREVFLRGLYTRELDGQTVLHGCTVRFVSSAERTGGDSWSHLVDRWRIVAVRALDDAARSERAHDEAIDRLRGAFRGDDTLGGVVAGITDGGLRGIQVDDSGPLMWSGVLCHHTRMSLATLSVVNHWE